MPQCCAFDCYTQQEKGKRFFLLPTGARNEERKKIWMQKINRKNWIPNKNTRLCEAHFTSDQFELNRADGIRKLKPNAIPTIFSHRPMKVGRKPPAERSTIDGITTSKKRKRQDSNTYREELPTPMRGFPVEDPENAEGTDTMDLHQKVVELTRKLNIARGLPHKRCLNPAACYSYGNSISCRSLSWRFYFYFHRSMDKYCRNSI